MLGKLLKHELRATWRIFLPVYGVLLIMAALTKLSFAISEHVNSNFAVLPTAIFGFGFVVSLAAVAFVTVFIMVQRFYKSLLGDSGYLMFTLPVAPWQLILSRMFAAMIWMLASVVTASLSFLLFAVDTITLPDIGQFFQGFADLFGEVVRSKWVLDSIVWGLELLLTSFFSMAAGILFYYLAISIGHQFRNHRLLAAIGAFFVMTTALQILGSMLIFPAAMIYDRLEWAAVEPEAAVHVILLVMTLFSAAAAAVCFFITNHLLSKRLNLN